MGAIATPTVTSGVATLTALVNQVGTAQPTTSVLQAASAIPMASVKKLDSAPTPATVQKGTNAMTALLAYQKAPTPSAKRTLIALLQATVMK